MGSYVGCRHGGQTGKHGPCKEGPDDVYDLSTHCKNADMLSIIFCGIAKQGVDNSGESPTVGMQTTKSGIKLGKVWTP